MTEPGKLSRIAVLGAAAVAAYVFESLLASPLPFARIGVSNVFVVVALFGFGFGEAFLVNLVRVLAGSLLLGFTLSPAFVFSLAGSMSALGVMALAKWKAVPPLSVIGTSCAGAATSNLVQIALFTALFARWPVPAALLGGFLILGVAVGLLTGVLAAVILRKVVLERYGAVN
jgi:heptaprenyl diphosphate synthase